VNIKSNNEDTKIRGAGVMQKSQDTVLSKGIEEKRFNFIAKPLVFSDLLTKIREVLEGPVFSDL